MQGLIHCY